VGRWVKLGIGLAVIASLSFGQALAQTAPPSLVVAPRPDTASAFARSSSSCPADAPPDNLDKWRIAKELEDEAALRACALSSNGSILEGVAGNWRTPPDVLGALAGRGNPLVRRAVAKNPSAPQDILRALNRDSETAVRVDLAANPSLPDDLLEAFVGQALRSDGFPLDDSDHIARGIALNPRTPEPVLRQFAIHPWFPIRQNVGMNLSTPADVLQALARDETASVRAQAEANLRQRAAQPPSGASAAAGAASEPTPAGPDPAAEPVPAGTASLEAQALYDLVRTSPFDVGELPEAIERIAFPTRPSLLGIHERPLGEGDRRQHIVGEVEFNFRVFPSPGASDTEKTGLRYMVYQTEADAQNAYADWFRRYPLHLEILDLGYALKCNRHTNERPLEIGTGCQAQLGMVRIWGHSTLRFPSLTAAPPLGPNDTEIVAVGLAQAGVKHLEKLSNQASR
jgi:hypothetical protein